MEKKKADNRTVNTKQKIKEIDDRLDIERKKLQKLDDMREEIISLNKNMDKCIDLLAKSIKGPVTKSIFNDMYDSNKIFFIKANSAIDEENNISKKEINKLYQEKDKLIKENKEKEE